MAEIRKQKILPTGCKLSRSFDPGLTDDWAKKWQEFKAQGFRELFFEAPFHWSMINLDSKVIIANIEGDFDIIDCSMAKPEAMMEQVKNTFDFMRKQGYAGAIFGEEKGVMKAMKEKGLV